MPTMTMTLLRRLAAAAMLLAAAALPATGCSSILDPGPTTTAALHCADPHGMELIIGRTGTHRNRRWTPPWCAS